MCFLARNKYIKIKERRQNLPPRYCFMQRNQCYSFDNYIVNIRTNSHVHNRNTDKLFNKLHKLFCRFWERVVIITVRSVPTTTKSLLNRFAVFRINRHIVDCHGAPIRLIVDVRSAYLNFS